MNTTVLETIYSRRSTRKFLQEPLEEDCIENLQKAAECAPSKKNEQPWFFVFIQNPSIISQLEELAEPEGDAHGAPLLVIAFADMKAESPVTDTVLSLANMQYAAEGMGLGSCFVSFASSVCNQPQYAELPGALGVPEGYMAVSALAIGKKDPEEVKPYMEKKTAIFSMVY